MPFCSNCGQQLADGVKFCSNCGSQVGAPVMPPVPPTPPAQPAPKAEKNENEFVVYKCPGCHATIKSFMTECPYCGFEIRGVHSVSTVKELAEKLENSKSESHRIIIIKNFPIPNTKEDIFEFMLLATSNFKADDYAMRKGEENISDAWLTKIEQCYQKAVLSFAHSSDFKKIEDMYKKVQTDCKEKEEQLKTERAEQKEVKEKKENVNNFKTSKFRIVLIIFTILAPLFAIGGIGQGKIISGVIGVVMTVFFVLALLVGNGIMCKKSKNLHVALGIIGIVLCVAFLIVFAVEQAAMTAFLAPYTAE